MFRQSSLFAVLLLSSAALSATAPIEVSLTVKESCVVEQRDAHPLPAPAVSCALDSPYLVRSVDGERPDRRDRIPASVAVSPSTWEVVF